LNPQEQRAFIPIGKDGLSDHPSQCNSFLALCSKIFGNTASFGLLGVYFGAMEMLFGRPLVSRRKVMRISQFFKRSALSVGLGLALMVVIALRNLPHGISKWADFQKIKPGMTKAEVESIMGETENWFSTGVGPIMLGWNIDATVFSDEYCLVARFDYQKKVTKTESYPVESSHFRRLLRSMGLR
jgi:hypothetical protein